MVTGNMIYNNGQGAVAGQRNGILSEGGELIGTGNKSSNLAGASQLYGIAANHGKLVLTGNDLRGNAIGATGALFIGGGATADTFLSNNPGA